MGIGKLGYVCRTTSSADDVARSLILCRDVFINLINMTLSDETQGRVSYILTRYEEKKEIVFLVIGAFKLESKVIDLYLFIVCKLIAFRFVQYSIGGFILSFGAYHLPVFRSLRLLQLVRKRGGQLKGTERGYGARGTDPLTHGWGEG